MINKTTKNAAPFILAFLLPLLCLAAVSCEKSEVYGLAEKLLGDDEGVYSFSADLSLEIEGNLDGAVPGELVFRIGGRAKGGDAEIEIALVQADGEDMEFAAILHKRGDLLFFELNELSKIFADLLCSTGMVDTAVKELFDTMAGYDGAVLYVELESFGLGWIEGHMDRLSGAFTVKSSVSYQYPDDVEIPEYELRDGLSLGRIKNSIEKELLKLPYYRYSELYVVLETDVDGANFMNILATRERGDREILERFKLDSDLARVRENPELVYYENILPMRYLMELLGETVGWDADKKTAYILDGGNKLYFEGELINSTTYIPLNHIISRTDYIVNSVSAGEYIEFKILRR